MMIVDGKADVLFAGPNEGAPKGADDEAGDDGADDCRDHGRGSLRLAAVLEQRRQGVTCATSNSVITLARPPGFSVGWISLVSHRLQGSPGSRWSDAEPDPATSCSRRCR